MSLSVWKLLTLSCCVIGLVVGSRASAQEKPTTAPVPATADGASIETLQRRIEKLEQELTALKLGQGAPVDPAKQRLVVMINSINFHQVYVTNQETKNLVLRVTLINLTDKPADLPVSAYTVKADQAELKIVSLPQQMRNYSVYDGIQSISYQQMGTSAVTLQPGEATQQWLVFMGMPGGNRVPKMQLSIRTSPDNVQQINLNETLGRQLQLKTERIGPRNSLAVMTIGGPLNTVSLNYLFDEMQKLSENKVARVVLQWREGAPAADQQVYFWLAELARNRSNNNVNSSFPPFPSGIGELHLVQPGSRQPQPSAAFARRTPNPTFNAGLAAGVNGNPGVHETVEDAASAALASAYQVVPRNELLEEIRNGHAWCRPGALANGGGRLLAEDLPLLLRYADDDSPNMQRAAIRALRHFGEDEAIAKLMHYAQRNLPNLSPFAVDSLAGSQFGKAHEALLGFLKTDTSASRKLIIQSLGRYPRPIWSEALFGYVEDKQSDVRVEALTVLNQIGHPKLVDALESALHDENRVLSESALNILATRSDMRSERLATDFTLKHIETALPTPAMLALLRKTRDQRALPALLKLASQKDPRRRELLEVLCQIGDEKVFAKLIELYGSLETVERASILGQLGRMRTPQIRELAQKELNSSDYSIMSQAASALSSDGSPSAHAMLIEAFRKPGNDNRFNILSSIVASMGTPAARSALREALNQTTLPARKQQLQALLKTLAARSPANQFVFQGFNLEEQKKFAEAAKLYDQAIEIDPEHPESRIARGNLALKRDQLDAAKADYKKVMELDPENSQGPTNLGIVLARQGQLDEATKLVEDARPKFLKDGLFLYNAACVYGRAFEYVRDHADTPNREERLKSFERKALNDLSSSVEIGLDEKNTNWMKEDPDLAALRQHPEFKQLSARPPKG